MLLFPNAKLNLGLFVGRKRPDGFHDLKSIFIPIDLHDSLEITSSAEFQLQVMNVEVSGPANDNLITKAFELMSREYGIPPVRISLVKRIPMGGGLAGGSSNGTFTLLGLNDHFNLNLRRETLMEHAAELGSDCPFFVVNDWTVVEGRGEQVTRIKGLNEIDICLVQPQIHISTGEAFEGIDQREELPSFDPLPPLKEWRDHFANDFEKGVFAKYPELSDIKQSLYDQGASYASLTGTGSCIYGIFEEQRNLSLPAKFTWHRPLT